VTAVIALDRIEESEPLARDCYERSKVVFGPEHNETQDAILLLVKLYDAWGKPERAAEWRALLPESAEAAEPPEP